MCRAWRKGRDGQIAPVSFQPKPASDVGKQSWILENKVGYLQVPVYLFVRIFIIFVAVRHVIFSLLLFWFGHHVCMKIQLVFVCRSYGLQMCRTHLFVVMDFWVWITPSFYIPDHVFVSRDRCTSSFPIRKVSVSFHCRCQARPSIAVVRSGESRQPCLAQISAGKLAGFHHHMRR